MELSEKNRDAITRLAKSSDAQKLMELLRRQNGQVQQAAQAAAAGRGISPARSRGAVWSMALRRIAAAASAIPARSIRDSTNLTPLSPIGGGMPT